MKPANFPARKELRRQEAITRMNDAILKGSPNAKELEKAIDNTIGKLVSTGVARTIRTKKYRGSNA